MGSRSVIGLAVASLLVIAIAGYLFAASAKSRLAAQFPAPGRMVDVGGYRLHLHCMGEGKPTVVLEAGLNEFSVVWTSVQSEAAKFARVCAYDRAGFGWSERGSLARTSANMVQELHALLRRAGIEGPLVLAGHSFGGLLARQYAFAYPGEVAGLVLVDATHEDYLLRVPAIARRAREGARDFRRLAWISRAGLMALSPGKIPARGLKGEALARYRATLATGDFFETAAEETAMFEENLAGARALPLGSPGALPLVVLSRGQADPQPFLSPEENARYEREWRALQSRLATLSSRGRQVVAARSGHAIQLSEPELVVEAIRSVVADRS